MAEIDAGLRVDAARNRTRILAAARDLFATHGPNVPMETIAQHADVGIGTLYRRFPHRSDLVCAVAVELWRQIAIEAKRAEAEEVDAFAALGRYMHRALDIRISAVMPQIVASLDLSESDRGLCDEAGSLLESLVETAHQEGDLDPEIRSGDIGLLLIRFARPLPPPIPLAISDEMAHRHLEIVLRGLRTSTGEAGAKALPAPALSIRDLAQIREQPEEDSS